MTRYVILLGLTILGIYGCQQNRTDWQSEAHRVQTWKVPKTTVTFLAAELTNPRTTVTQNFSNEKRRLIIVWDSDLQSGVY